MDGRQRSSRRVSKRNGCARLIRIAAILPAPGRASARPRVGLVSHLDKVFRPEEEQGNGFRRRQSGDRAYGPGTVDTKGGTVAMFPMLQVLRRAPPHRFERVDQTLSFTGAEEVLSSGFGRLARKRLAGAAALVFEGGRRSGEAWTVVTSRKRRAVFRIRIDGRGPHAGRRMGRGPDAILQLAETLLRVGRLTTRERSRSVNLGRIHGSTTVNRVPEEAESEAGDAASRSDSIQEGRAALPILAGTGGVRPAWTHLPAAVSWTCCTKGPQRG